MWPAQFKDRLQSWNNLRTQCATLSNENCLQQIDAWWQQSPWKPYYLHWDDYPTWPDPWNLLADNVYCDLAHALGIVYTIMIIEQKDFGMVEIADTDQGNLVLVNHGKYILNWGRDRSLNSKPTNFTITKSLNSSDLVHLLG